MHAREMHACEIHTREMHAREVHALDMHAREVHAHETHAYEIYAREVHAHEIPAHQMHSRPPTLQTVVRWSICRDLSLQNTSFCAKLWGGPYRPPHAPYRGPSQEDQAANRCSCELRFIC